MSNDQIAWSWSRLNRYRKCQLQSFWMDYAPKAEKVVEPPNPIFEKGKIMHSSMESALKKGTPLPAGMPVPGGQIVDLSHLEGVVSSLRNSERLWVENQLAFDKNLRPTSWFGKDAWCRVIWDAAGKNSNKINMIDWKSGRPKAEPEQLELFAASVLTALPEIEEVHTHYVFLEHKKYTHDVFYKSAANHIWQKFGEEAERIQISYETGHWEPDPGDFKCRYCPVPKSKCQYSQVEG